MNLPVSKSLAIRLSDSLVLLDTQLNEMLREMQPITDVETFNALRRSVGDILGIFYLDIVKHVYENHPEIKPAGMP
jgi:hypothetical protein